jgi:hypothetical protein
MSIEDIKKKLSSGLVEELINEPSAHYVHILLLRNFNPAPFSPLMGKMQILPQLESEPKMACGLFSGHDVQAKNRLAATDERAKSFKGTSLA